MKAKTGRLLYTVVGESELGPETAQIIAANETEVAQFARRVLEFETITAITLDNDNVYA